MLLAEANHHLRPLSPIKDLTPEILPPSCILSSLSPASFSSAHKYSGPSPILILLPHLAATSFLSLLLPQALFGWTFPHLT